MIRVAIIEDQREVREGLSTLLGLRPGYAVSATYSSAEQALDRIGGCLPDVALVDIGLPGMSGVDAIRVLRQRHPAMPCLVLTSFDDDARVFSAMCAGACGYLLKRTPPADLLDAIREIHEGGAPMTPQIARQVVELFRDKRPPADSGHRLTPQELNLLKLLVDGHSYKTAAFELGVTIHAISFHIRNVYDKLQVHSKSEAVAKAIRRRLV